MATIGDARVAMEMGHNTTVAAVYLDVGQSLNASYGPHFGPVPLGQPAIAPPPKTKTSDPSGEGYYVIAVFLVYGMSIVLLIASHIRRKHSKLAIDKEICKYLQEFQIVKETSNRDSYRNLKRSIIAKLLRDKPCARKGVANLALPMAAVALPSDPPSEPEDDDDDDDAGVVADLSEDRSKSYADLDTWVEDEGLAFQRHQDAGRCMNEAIGYHGNQVPELRELSGISDKTMSRNAYHGDHELQALNKVKQADLISRYAFDGNGYHVIRIPEVSECKPEAVGRCVDDSNGYRGNQAIRAPQLRRHDERDTGTGSGGRTQLKTETEVSGLRSPAAEYAEALRQVGLTVGSRDPRWILLPLLLENRMRTERQDHEERKQDEEEAEEEMNDEPDEETANGPDEDNAVAECSTERGDDVVSYTYVL